MHYVLSTHIHILLLKRLQIFQEKELSFSVSVYVAIGCLEVSEIKCTNFLKPVGGIKITYAAS